MIDIEKKDLLDVLIPKAVLLAINEKSKYAITRRTHNKDMIPIFTFPFRIGRESRTKYIDGKIVILERHKLDGQKPNNDAYLLDDGSHLQISREHCSVVENDGVFLLHDRGSACGSMVNQFRVGGDDQDGSYSLKDGDIITIGTEKSEYKYKFILLDVECV